MAKKLTKEELKRVNEISSLRDFCRAVLEIVDNGAIRDTEYFNDCMWSVTAILKKTHPVFKLIIQ